MGMADGIAWGEFNQTAFNGGMLVLYLAPISGNAASMKIKANLA